MGCAVEFAEDGTEIDVHRFDTFEDAKQYVEKGRRYVFDRLDAWGIDGNIHCFVGPNPGEHAAIRRSNDGKGWEGWRASFWIVKPKPAKVTVLDTVRVLLPQLSKAELVALVEEAAELNNRRLRLGETYMNVERRRYIGTLEGNVIAPKVR